MPLTKEEFKKFFGKEKNRVTTVGAYTIKSRMVLGEQVFELKNRGISIGFFKKKTKAIATRDNLIKASILGKKLGKRIFKELFPKPIIKRKRRKK